MKKNLILLWLLLGCSIAMIAVGFVFDRNSQPNAPPAASNAEPHIDIAMQEEDFSLVSALVEEWLGGTEKASEIYARYHPLGLSYGEHPVEIRWGIFDIPDGTFIRKQFFELSVDEDFRDIRHFDLRSGERNIVLYRLLPDQTYYFKITVELENGQCCTADGRFRTKWSPRVLEFKSLDNVRDIGGWSTADGKTVRYGMLYRGCELDGATGKSSVITEDDTDILVQELKINTQLDLRAPGLPGVKDQPGVKHLYFDLPSYAGTYTGVGNERLRQVFAALATEENYPVYLNCTDGADRTGIVCFLLEALLGVPEEDCYRDWELSVLSNGSGSYEAMDRFLEKLHKTEGTTLKEKTENYLISIGVTQEEIDSIRNILVD